MATDRSEDDGQKLHVALLASPGLGHLIPVLVIGNRLATHHDVKITILVIASTTSPAETELIQKLTESLKLDTLLIPQADISHLIDSETKIVTQLCILVRETLPRVRSAIAGMENRPDVLVGDLFCSEAFSIATDFNMPKYLYIASNAWFTALLTYSPVLDKLIEGEYVDQTEPLEIPGCKPVRPEDVVDPMLERSDQVYKEYLQIGSQIVLAEGILVNTWEDLEPQTLEAFVKNETFKATVRLPPVYPVGPLRRSVEPTREKVEVLDWLDAQPPESVLYVSFGSGGTLSVEQTTELAIGLELSQQRFIWVIRPPAEEAAGSYFTSGSGPGVKYDFLPEGFLSRTKNTGLLIPLWAPQVEILSHPSVGGFLSHCGWGSTLESLTNGVPMIAWPLYSEQRQNATLLVEELGAAVRPKVLPTKKVVGREEIDNMVRTILVDNEEGKRIRDRVKQLRLSGEKALLADGSSFNNTNQFVNDAKTLLK